MSSSGHTLSLVEERKLLSKLIKIFFAAFNEYFLGQPKLLSKFDLHGQEKTNLKYQFEPQYAEWILNKITITLKKMSQGERKCI